MEKGEGERGEGGGIGRRCKECHYWPYILII